MSRIIADSTIETVRHHVEYMCVNGNIDISKNRYDAPKEPSNMGTEKLPYESILISVDVSGSTSVTVNDYRYGISRGISNRSSASTMPSSQQFPSDIKKIEEKKSETKPICVAELEAVATFITLLMEKFDLSGIKITYGVFSTYVHICYEGIIHDNKSLYYDLIEHLDEITLFTCGSTNLYSASKTIYESNMKKDKKYLCLLATDGQPGAKDEVYTQMMTMGQVYYYDLVVFGAGSIGMNVGNNFSIVRDPIDPSVIRARNVPDINHNSECDIGYLKTLTECASGVGTYLGAYGKYEHFPNSFSAWIEDLKSIGIFEESKQSKKYKVDLRSFDTKKWCYYGEENWVDLDHKVSELLKQGKIIIQQSQFGTFCLIPQVPRRNETKGNGNVAGGYQIKMTVTDQKKKLLNGIYIIPKSPLITDYDTFEHLLNNGKVNYEFLVDSGRIKVEDIELEVYGKAWEPLTIRQIQLM